MMIKYDKEQMRRKGNAVLIVLSRIRNRQFAYILQISSIWWQHLCSGSRRTYDKRLSVGDAKAAQQQASPLLLLAFPHLTLLKLFPYTHERICVV